MATASARSEAGQGNRVTAVHSEWWQCDSGAVTLARVVAAQQG